MTPDSWSILKIDRAGEIVYKVFAGWAGGYLYGDSWKLNSGIQSYKENADSVDMNGYSGSCYHLPFASEGRHTAYNFGILNSITDNAKVAGVEIKVISIQQFFTEFKEKQLYNGET